MRKRLQKSISLQYPHSMRKKFQTKEITTLLIKQRHVEKLNKLEVQIKKSAKNK